MSNFIRHPQFFYTADEAHEFGLELVGSDGLFEVRRIPAAPIEDLGPGGLMTRMQVAEYAVFTARSR
jgi:hypothetical protein